MTTQEGVRVARVAYWFMGSHFAWFGLSVTVTVERSLGPYNGLIRASLRASLKPRGYGGAGLRRLYCIERSEGVLVRGRGDHEGTNRKKRPDEAAAHRLRSKVFRHEKGLF